MGSPSFQVVPSDPALYRKWAQDYWKWVQGKDPDSDPTNPEDQGVTFLRDDIIGPQLRHDVGIAPGPSPGERPFEKKISVKTGTKIFFPVYQVMSADKHPYVEGGNCDSTEKRKDAARKDLDNCFQKWAKIDDVDILHQSHDVEPDEDFDLKVPEKNKLDREAGFNLPVGTHKSIVAGTYLCLENLKPGTYTIDFGGRATDFHTHSIYTVIVT